MLKLDVVFLGFRFRFLDWHHASILGTVPIALVHTVLAYKALLRFLDCLP